MSQMTQAPNRCVLVPEKDIVASSFEEFRKQLQELLDGGCRELVIDLQKVQLVDSRGLALFMLKRNAEAAEAFTQEIKAQSDSGMPYLHRARVYAADKKNKEAIEDIDQAMKVEPDNRDLVAKGLLLRAQVHQQAGDNKAARADLDQALKDTPGLAPALEMRAILSVGDSDYGQAIEDFKQLLKVAPKNPELLDQLGMLYALNKQPRKAISSYSDALDVDAENFSALRGRADAYLNTGDHGAAVTDYEAALKLRPDDEGVLNNLAWVLATSPDDKVRNGKRSIELGTQAAKLGDYKQAHVLSTLAAGYAETGDFDNAQKWSQKAVDIGSDDDETNQQLKKELASYQSKKPWREKQVLDEKNDSDSAPAEKHSSTKKLPGPPPVNDGSSAANGTDLKNN